jgi:imidazolonepropionase-like amidohydrolase
MKRQHVFLEGHMHAFVVAVAETRSGSTTVADQPDSPIITRLRSVLAQPFSAQRAYEAGVMLAYGSDTGIVRHGDNGAELIELTKIGLTSLQAIQVATLNSAQAIGLSAEIGSIEVGKQADVIASSGRPLGKVSDLTHVTFVMRGGHVFKMQ